ARQALPIFAGFMKQVYDDKTLGISMQDRFAIPQGAIIYNCSYSGWNPTETEAVSRVDDEFFD
ncbi:MAG: hypothetical protein LUD68_00020, partial [Rikenellaceae bacterium]|nr:hypothetical protein [Rikenellaceae bacterium]